MDDRDLDRLRDLLTSGPVWGAEVDLQYRVLALTIEPTSDRHPQGDAEDRRLQVLLHPVGAIAAALVRHEPGPAPDDAPRRTVLRFDQAQLPDVVAALDGADVVGDPLPDALPNLDAMEERLSLRGVAQVAEGHRLPLALHLVADDLTLDLWATFDDVEVRTPDGEVLADW
ncbi:hypothetical protein [Salsipaludibacter albus]|uniref:hypothetical protein n=1 Tax=Salsipaludibacter albus TaxID=2849650 RepID=UPI001EE4AC6B|nr:hypothetical protein [Salsipaludibacter albus]MBY5161523.1 hypothetical protein [Salsipaludibacter albus]